MALAKMHNGVELDTTHLERADFYDIGDKEPNGPPGNHPRFDRELLLIWTMPGNKAEYPPFFRSEGGDACKNKAALENAGFTVSTSPKAASGSV